MNARHHGEVGQGREGRDPHRRRRGPEAIAEAASALFQPFASSENTVRFCARKASRRVPADAAGLRGKALQRLFGGLGKPKGQGIGVLRDVIIADTEAEAIAMSRDSASSRAAPGRASASATASGAQERRVPDPEEITAGLCLCRPRRPRAAGHRNPAKAPARRLILCYT